MSIVVIFVPSKVGLDIVPTAHGNTTPARGARVR